MVKIGALEEEIRPSQCVLTEANILKFDKDGDAGYPKRTFFVIKSVIKVCCRKN
jgi:hypothetical protein